MKNSVLTLAIATMMAAVSVQAQEHASSVHKHNQGSNASVGLGLINIADSIKGIQLSPVSNIAEYASGLQLSPFSNVAYDGMTGLQLSVLIPNWGSISTSTTQRL